MNEFLSVVFTAVLAFSATDYTLARAQVSDPIRVVISAVFAILLVVIVGALTLVEVIN